MLNCLISIIAVISLSVERVSLFSLKENTVLLLILCQCFVCPQAPRELQLLLTKVEWAESRLQAQLAVNSLILLRTCLVVRELSNPIK